MFRLRLMLSVLILGVTLLLVQSDSAHQPPLGQAEAVKLAKAAADQLQSAPRLYSDVKSEVSEWGNEPSSVTGYGIIPSGVARPNSTFPVTYTTVATSEQEGKAAYVTFLVTWGADNTVHHSWQLLVDENRRVTFIREEGDALPKLSCGNQCS